MNTVFVNIGLSLDGYMAPDGMTMGKPEHKNWGARWGELMAWIINQQYFRERLNFGPGGETGAVNDMRFLAELGWRIANAPDIPAYHPSEQFARPRLNSTN